jgi:hypothetical protein
MAALSARIDELGAQRKKFVSDRAFAERRMSDRPELMRERKKRAGNVRNEKECAPTTSRAPATRSGLVETEVLQLMSRSMRSSRRSTACVRSTGGRTPTTATSRRRLPASTAARGARGDSRRARRGHGRRQRRLVAQYDTVLQRRNGVAVVTVEDGCTCGGCHMGSAPGADRACRSAPFRSARTVSAFCTCR